LHLACAEKDVFSRLQCIVRTIATDLSQAMLHLR